MNVGDIVYWDSFGLKKPLLIVEIRDERSKSCVTWATVIELLTQNRYDFCLCNLRTREQMQGW